MQVTLDLPEDAFQIADAMAKEESRSLGSVIADFIRRRPRTRTEPVVAKAESAESLVPLAPGERFPVSPGRPVTLEEIEKMLEEDGLP